jgi:hypothetical protein
MNTLATELEPEVPPEEIAAAETQETPQETPKEEAKPEVVEKEKTVPHGAFHEERERRKALQRELEEARRERAVLNDRFERLFAAQKQAEAPQYRDPEKDPDPLTAMQHNDQINRQRLEAMQQQLAQDNERRQHEFYESQVIAWGQERANEYRQEVPDFDDAYQHIRMVRANELHAIGYNVAEIKQALRNDELGIINEAGKRGRNPAEIVYNMAKAAGYTGKKPAQDAEQKIEQLQKGQQAAKTVGNGAASSGWPTAEQIADMSEDDFAALETRLKKSGKTLSDII